MDAGCLEPNISIFKNCMMLFSKYLLCPFYSARNDKSIRPARKRPVSVLDSLGKTEILVCEIDINVKQSGLLF